MKISCIDCNVKGEACGDCVVTLLLALPEPDGALNQRETAALEVLAGSGLVPPLRLEIGKRRAI